MISINKNRVDCAHNTHIGSLTIHWKKRSVFVISACEPVSKFSCLDNISGDAFGRYLFVPHGDRLLCASCIDTSFIYPNRHNSRIINIFRFSD